LSVTLIPVDSLEQEAAIIERLASWRAHFGGPVAPVMDRNGLVSRVSRVLRGYQLAVEIATVPADVPPGPAADPAPAGPGLLVVSTGVDPAVERLAAALGGVAAQHLPVPRAQIARSISPGRRSCLMLLNPDATPPGECLDLAASLAALEIPWGLLYAVDPIEARFGILKSFLVHTVTSEGKFQFLSSAYQSPGSDADPPPGGQQPRRTTADRIAKAHDVLLLTGHANMLDSWIDSDAVLCAREGYAGSGADADLASCFNGGRCYRQPAIGPQRELIGIRRARPKVLVLSGCNVLPLGKGWCRTTATIAYQTAQTDILGLITASVISLASVELDLLCLALIARGLPLGEVVAEINRVRRDELGQPTGLPSGLGPFVLLGNPALRLAPFPNLVDGRLESTDGATPYRISAERPAETASGMLVRARLPPRRSVPFLFGDGSPCRGVWHHREDEAFLYLLFLATASAHEPGKSFELTVEAVDQDELAPFREMLAQCWGSAPFWTMFLRSYSEDLKHCEPIVLKLNEQLAALPEHMYLLATFWGGLQLTPGILIARKTILRGIRPLWHVIDRWAGKLLDTLTDMTVEVGRVSSCGNPPFYHLAEPTSEAEPCPCGGVLTGQIFRSPDALHQRIYRQCTVCGSSRDEDGRSMLRLTGPHAEMRVGCELSFECSIAAPSNAYLHLNLVLVLETWLRDRRVTSPMHHQTLVPGEEKSVVLKLDVPPDIPPGVYPVAILGILNGAFYALRRSVPFAARAAPVTTPSSASQEPDSAFRSQCG